VPAQIVREFEQGLNGLSSIRSKKKQQKTLSKSAVAIDRHINTHFAMMSANRRVALCLEFLGWFLELITGVFCVSAWDFTGAGLAGLALTYALQMTSVEHCDEAGVHGGATVQLVGEVNGYTMGVEPESPRVIEGSRPPSSKADRGLFENGNVHDSYRPDLLAVWSLAFTVHPQHKVVIVGRTCAGKSSALLALFRKLTGSNPHRQRGHPNLGLKDLWSKIAIIRLTLLILKRTMRLFLEPFYEYTAHGRGR